METGLAPRRQERSSSGGGLNPVPCQGEQSKTKVSASCLLLKHCVNTCHLAEATSLQIDKDVDMEGTGKEDGEFHSKHHKLPTSDTV